MRSRKARGLRLRILRCVRGIGLLSRKRLLGKLQRLRSVICSYFRTRLLELTDEEAEREEENQSYDPEDMHRNFKVCNGGGNARLGSLRTVYLRSKRG